MTKIYLTILCFQVNFLFAQEQWKNSDSLFGVLPQGFHVFFTNDSLDGEPFKAWYAEADLNNKKLDFTCDTTLNRRLTPRGFHKKNNQPLLVVNTTFFSFETNRSLNVVIKNGKLVSQNITSVPLKGKDTFSFTHSFSGAIGISKKRNADVAWIYTDSSTGIAYAAQNFIEPIHDSLSYLDIRQANLYSAEVLNAGVTGIKKSKTHLQKWKMQTAVGGGPVLVQDGKISISNDEEMKFTGKAIHDKHPRTLMGYTKTGKLIIMVIEGRHPGVAMGADLEQAAKLMQQLGCVEALNLDGGGSSCMLINGRETIYTSDKGEERPVPAVFIINAKAK